MKVFVGYDPMEDAAYRVCRSSLLRHASPNVTVHPLEQSVLRTLGLYARAPDDRAATAFSLTRFLTPYLAANEGRSVFVDCDFLFTTSIERLVGSLQDGKAVHVVPHDYVPKRATKMGGRPQSTYPRKNWSSLMVFEGAHPKVRALTPQVVNAASPAFLHRLRWLEDREIGTLDPTWNFLVGEYEPNEKAPPAAIHFTNGGPWLSSCRDVPFARLWWEEYERVAASRASNGAAEHAAMAPG